VSSVPGTHATAQEDSTSSAVKEEGPAKVKPVKNTLKVFGSSITQTVLVPVKGTMEMDIMHRFGTVNNGLRGFLGFFCSFQYQLALAMRLLKSYL
jgi:hypothetical protein